MNYVIRSIRADEWRAVRELRLAALQDPVAHLAFMETYEDSVTKPDSFWQERTARGAEGATGVQQIIAEDADGRWVGTLTVLMEEAGSTDWAGFPVERRQGHVVGVYVRPEARGTGLTKELFEAGLEWAWDRGAERVRLIVHEENGRAQGLYRKVGFVPSGAVVPLAAAPGESELEFVLERR
ncbi:GNAT family N-acetyltransferase [Streptomyces lincolnensis]|uniref:GNAT family N-acetyltransferase n=1 Tax=Streptomyces lincolnensis TaxID=1915 RepID=UPI001E334BB8|nr:GNAT family N-acetyltransferase [Streptomyces lincolnensis]MCD7445481.1 GNAT family N-acetyltransferase [Streptomyces lincolnensis]